MPASNSRALEKARSLDCDVVALDLEDAVAPEAKEAARDAACAAVAARAFGNKTVVIRINPLSSPWGAQDLQAVARARPDAVILPKVEAADDIARLGKVTLDMDVWAMIETPQAVLNAAAIAAQAQCLILGGNDLLKAMGGQPMGSRENLWTAMSLVVLAARAFGIGAIDGTYNDLGNSEGLSRACEQGRAFGFDGKTLIHPGQIETANRAFAPSEEDIAKARRIQAAFRENPDKNVLALDGAMVERLHAEEAAKLLALAEAIQNR